MDGARFIIEGELCMGSVIYNRGRFIDGRPDLLLNGIYGWEARLIIEKDL
jgi:hypothetical protein